MKRGERPLVNKYMDESFRESQRQLHALKLTSNSGFVGSRGTPLAFPGLSQKSLQLATSSASDNKQIVKRLTEILDNSALDSDSSKNSPLPHPPLPPHSAPPLSTPPVSSSAHSPPLKSPFDAPRLLNSSNTAHASGSFRGRYE